MELEINESFAKHYNEYRAKEEAAKTKKNLKRQIKEIEKESESESCSSDTDYDEEDLRKFQQKCDFVLRKFQSKTIDVLSNENIFSDLTGPRSSESITKTEKPVYAKDLNRQILLQQQGNGDDIEANEKELDEIEKAGKLDSEIIINQARKAFDIANINGNESDNDSEDFLKPSNKPPKFAVKVEPENSDAESDNNYKNNNDNAGDKEDIKCEPIAIKINRDRKLETLRVSKTATRREKRKEKKERKEKELKEKMKKLKEIQQKGLQEKIDRIKKIVPQAAEELILNELDEDFDVDEISRRLTAFFQQEDEKIPIDEEKPVFSDLSDEETAEIDSDQEEIDEELEEQGKKKKEKNSNKKENSKKEKKKENKKNHFFTNLEIADQKIDSKKKIGIVQKTQEIFDPEKHKSLAKFMKKNFDYFCEDLIVGKEGDDLPCRFKFRAVEQQDYGLDIEEILFSDRRELNRWASLKKITQIRTKAEEERDRSYYEKVKPKKHEVLKSFYGKESEAEESEEDGQEKTEEKTSLSKAAKKRARKHAKKRTFHELVSETDADHKSIETHIDIESNEPNEKKIKSDNSSFKKSNKKYKENNIQSEISNEINSSEIDIESKTEFDSKSIKKSKKKKNEIDLEAADLKNEDKRKSNENEIEKHQNKKNKNRKKSGNKISGSDLNRLANENQGEQADDNISSEKSHKKKKNKYKKTKKELSGPILSHSRLESLGVNEGYYRFEVMGSRK